jgi:hypothetical protein
MISKYYYILCFGRSHPSAFVGKSIMSGYLHLILPGVLSHLAAQCHGTTTASKQVRHGFVVLSLCRVIALYQSARPYRRDEDSELIRQISSRYSLGLYNTHDEAVR